MKGAGSPAWLLMLHTAGERGHGVRLQSCKNTLPKEGQRSIRKGLWHPPPGQIHGKGVCSEPDEQTSHDDNQIIFENEMRRGVGTKAYEKKNKVEVAEIGVLYSKAFLAPGRL